MMIGGREAELRWPRGSRRGIEPLPRGGCSCGRPIQYISRAAQHSANPAPATIDDEGFADAVTANPFSFTQTSPRNRSVGLADAGFSCLGLGDDRALERQHAPDKLPVPVVVLDGLDQPDRHQRRGHRLTNLPVQRAYTMHPRAACAR